MTLPRCTKLQSGLRGTIIRTSPGLVLLLQAQRSQDRVIHLAVIGNHRAAVILARSLSSRQATGNHGSNAKASSSPKVVQTSNNKTRRSGNSLVSATSVDELGIRRRSVGRSREQAAEVISLVARSRNPPRRNNMDLIIRETSERATDEASR